MVLWLKPERLAGMSRDKRLRPRQSRTIRLHASAVFISTAMRVGRCTKPIYCISMGR